MASGKSSDVIVVGAGIWGLACAYACAARGLSVQVFDAAGIGQGASGGIVGAMAPHTPDNWNPKKQFQFEALSTAHTFWSDIDTTSGLASGYGRIGRLQPILSQKQLDLAQRRTASAAELWRGTYHWTVTDRPPQIAESAAPFGVIHDTLSARIFPALATQSLAKACKNSGVQLHPNHPVTTLATGEISGPWGTATAAHIILAAGVGGFALLPDTSLGQGVKGQAALLKIALPDTPQIYADGVYIIPHANGTTAIGSTSENDWDTPTTTDEKLDAVLAKAQKILPTLRDAPVVNRWANLRPKARKRDPMLGPHPDLDGVFCALGPFKIGFGLAHKVGDTLADLIQEKPVDLPTSFTVAHHAG